MTFHKSLEPSPPEDLETHLIKGQILSDTESNLQPQFVQENETFRKEMLERIEQALKVARKIVFGGYQETTSLKTDGEHALLGRLPQYKDRHFSIDKSKSSVDLTTEQKDEFLTLLDQYAEVLSRFHLDQYDGKALAPQDDLKKLEDLHESMMDIANAQSESFAKIIKESLKMADEFAYLEKDRIQERHEERIARSLKGHENRLRRLGKQVVGEEDEVDSRCSVNKPRQTNPQTEPTKAQIKKAGKWFERITEAEKMEASHPDTGYFL